MQGGECRGDLERSREESGRGAGEVEGSVGVDGGVMGAEDEGLEGVGEAAEEVVEEDAGEDDEGEALRESGEDLRAAVMLILHQRRADCGERACCA